jgi:hypothetical protein
MLIGYGRVSTAEQNPAHRIDALTRAGVEPGDIHLDTASGAKASRPQLDLVLKLARAGDTLVVTRLEGSPPTRSTRSHRPGYRDPVAETGPDHRAGQQ